ncbi:MAG: sulfotransferase [Desulfovibrionaceae bacterium]
MTARNWRKCPIFLCGHRKSGTTLLLSLMDGHDQLCVYPSDSSFFYAYYPRYAEGEYSEEQRKKRIIETVYAAMESDAVKWKGECALDMKALEKRFYERMQGKECSPQILLSEAVFAYHDMYGQPREPLAWVEKTTSTEVYASQVFSWFPNARMIQLLRDPRDNFASLKSGWSARYSKRNEDVRDLMQSHLERAKMAFLMASANQELYGEERYLVLRFEDLVREPESVLQRIAAFAGVRYSDILLQPRFMGNPWKGNNFDGKVFDRPSAENVGRWKERITPEEAALIEFHFADVLDRWEYEKQLSTSEHVEAASSYYKWSNFRKAIG